VFRPLIEELDDLPIQPVNRFAMFGNVQAATLSGSRGCRILCR
jgi:hypothetical protein